ncbi:NAD(P)/FAD-dependent oxidoreductase [Streptomyces sp. NPDC001584]|uniref:flavin-containing monooxygenase n=1 Tax=Streptomyces sp. NPDC001584 TaxID=3154521 RepID=UPI00332A28A2
MEHVDVVVVGAGQAGLATACALVRHGLKAVVLEASGQPAGSWPRYYDSLTLFSPARFSSLPGMPFDRGDPDRYPHRDEVVAYLTAYAAHLDVDIRTGRRVAAVQEREGGFVVELEDGDRISARAVVSASGSFGSPYRPALPGLDDYEGAVLHASEYRSPEAFRGQRVIVVGAGNTAVQIAVELASVARVTLASRNPVKFAPNASSAATCTSGSSAQAWTPPPSVAFLRTPPTQPVFDTGRYRAAVDADAPDRRPLFASIAGKQVAWSDGVKEEVDAIVLATGYRPDLPYLADLGVTGGHGRPLHRDGFSAVHDRLAFVGLECQRTLSSNSLRGVGRDAERVARRMASGLGG